MGNLGLVDANCYIWSEVLLSSTGNCVQSLGLEHDGIWYEKKKNVRICMTGSLCCTTEIEGTLSISYTLIKTKEVLLTLHSLAMIPLPFLFQFSQHYKAVHFSGLKRRNHFGEKSQGLCR